MDNEEVIVANAQNDPEAFGRLYDKYYQPVFGFILNRTRNVEIAKDLTSETFFHCLKSIRKYKKQKGKTFKSWLFAIAVAQVGNYYRSRAKYLQVTTENFPELIASEAYQPNFAMIDKEIDEEKQKQIDQLRVHIAKLNQKQQNIITLKYYSYLTITEIATVMKMKEGTVKSHIHRAVNKLRTMMAEEEIAEKNTYDGEETAKTRTSLGISRV